VLGKNQDGYIVRLYGTVDILQSFGNDLKLITSKTIEFKNQTGLLQFVQLNKSGVTVFYLTGDKRGCALLGQPLSSHFIENGRPVLLDSIIDRPDFVNVNLRVKQSLNQQYTVFYYPYFKGDKLESIQFLCVDRALQKLYSRKLLLNRPDTEMETAKIAIDNNGNTYAVFLNNKEKHYRHAQETFTVYKILNGVEDAYETQLKVDRNLFGEFYFETDNVNNSVVLAGFFDDDNPSNEPAAQGFFYTVMDADSGTIRKLHYHSFDPAFIQELTGKLNQEPRLYTFAIKKTILRYDGGIAIIAESLIKDIRETMFNSQFSPTFNSIQRINYFQFNDIIVFSLSPQGQAEWKAILRKKQSSEEDNGIYSSFLLMNERSKLRFLYIDEITTAASLREYVLASDGKVSSSLIMNQEAKDVMLLPKAGKQVSPNEAVIPSYLRNQLRLVKITF
ncbi:MAG: hypothetical protein NZ522_03295, partial [Chitinophagales bacterium]|nr:hypothetical protein [Chitinophagales bacterium]